MDAARVFTATGKLLVESYESSRARVPLLAAVSPNRLMGPCGSTKVGYKSRIFKARMQLSKGLFKA